MISELKILKHPSLLLTVDVQTICAPLKEIGIEYFSHVDIEGEKQFSAISTHPKFAEIYHQKKYYNFDVHMIKLHQPEHYILWDTLELKKESLELYETLKSFEFGHFFSIILQNSNGRECFNFAGKLGNNLINNSYLHNLDLLKKFINYFKDKIQGHKELKKAYDIKFLLNKESGGHLSQENLEKINRIEFNKKINAERFYLDKKYYLTKRELECLYWISQGKTLQETAIILSITLRTVNAHIDNIKGKFSCDNQFQLGMLFQQFNKFNF